MKKDQLQDVTVPVAVQPLDFNRDLTMILLNNFLLQFNNIFVSN